MDNYPVYYSLKVWLSSALIAPMIYGILELCLTPDRLSLSNIEVYPILVILELVFSLLTWIMFWMVIELAIRLLSNHILRKCLISFMGVLLTIGTFKVFVFLDITFSLTNLFFVLMACNALCIAIGSWFYYPAPKVYSPEDFPS